MIKRQGFKGSPLRWRLEKWFWACMCPAWCALFFASRTLFLLISILYVIEISHWALVLSAAACETSAEARDKAALAAPDQNTGGPS